MVLSPVFIVALLSVQAPAQQHERPAEHLSGIRGEVFLAAPSIAADDPGLADLRGAVAARLLASGCTVLARPRSNSATIQLMRVASGDFGFRWSSTPPQADQVADVVQELGDGPAPWVAMRFSHVLTELLGANCGRRQSWPKPSGAQPVSVRVRALENPAANGQASAIESAVWAELHASGLQLNPDSRPSDWWLCVDTESSGAAVYRQAGDVPSPCRLGAGPAAIGVRAALEVHIAAIQFPRQVTIADPAVEDARVSATTPEHKVQVRASATDLPSPKRRGLAPQGPGVVGSIDVQTLVALGEAPVLPGGEVGGRLVHRTGFVATAGYRFMPARTSKLAALRLRDHLWSVGVGWGLNPGLGFRAELLAVLGLWTHAFSGAGLGRGRHTSAAFALPLNLRWSSQIGIGVHISFTFLQPFHSVRHNHQSVEVARSGRRILAGAGLHYQWGMPKSGLWRTRTRRRGVRR